MPMTSHLNTKDFPLIINHLQFIISTISPRRLPILIHPKLNSCQSASISNFLKFTLLITLSAQPNSFFACPPASLTLHSPLTNKYPNSSAPIITIYVTFIVYITSLTTKLLPLSPPLDYSRHDYCNSLQCSLHVSQFTDTGLHKIYLPEPRILNSSFSFHSCSSHTSLAKN